MSTNFKSRHIGPRSEQIQIMLEELGFDNLEEMTNSVIPKDILSDNIIEPNEILSLDPILMIQIEGLRLQVKSLLDSN